MLERMNMMEDIEERTIFIPRFNKSVFLMMPSCVTNEQIIEAFDDLSIEYFNEPEMPVSFSIRHVEGLEELDDYNIEINKEDFNRNQRRQTKKGKSFDKIKYKNKHEKKFY